MFDQLILFTIDESKWLTMSLGLALLIVLFTLRLQKALPISTRQKVMTVMNLFFSFTFASGQTFEQFSGMD